MSDRKKPDPPKSEEEYREARIELALAYAPAIKKCRECGWPVLVGYCCDTCGSSSP